MGKSNNNSDLVVALLAGAIVGATAAVLCAPQSGRKTRARLKKDAKRVANEVALTATGISENLTDNLKEGGEGVGYSTGAAIARTIINFDEIVKIVKMKLVELKLGVEADTQEENVYRLEGKSEQV